MLFALDGRGPLHWQVYVALRAAVLDSSLTSGARLPGSRTLARDLGVSRNTILLAIEQLVAEGYAEARRGSGTYIARELPSDSKRLPLKATANAASSAVRLSRTARAALPWPAVATWELHADARSIDFRYGESASRDLPIHTWARLYGRRVRHARARDLAYHAPGGHPALREALATYLARARGVRCSAEQVIVTAGSQQAVDLCLRVLIDPGDRVGLEDPTYPGFRVALAHARAAIVGIPVDDQGLRIDRLARVRKLRLVCVTPSHQFPTGALLPAARRLWLLDWARENDVYLLEDDYDGEFRYEGRPLESLQGRDAHQRVLYVGTFSKTMFPAMRLGYVVVPQPLVEPFLRLKAATDTGSANLDQPVLAEFIADGHLERHIRRARVRNAARREVLLAALEAQLGTRVRVAGAPAGLHVWLEVPGLAPERAGELRALARKQGVSVYSGAACHLRRPAHASFILGYTSLSHQQIERGIAGLQRALSALDDR